MEYFVKWRGYDDPNEVKNTLEPYKNLDLLFFFIYFFLQKTLGGQGGSTVNGGSDNKGLVYHAWNINDFIPCLMWG